MTTVQTRSQIVAASLLDTLLKLDFCPYFDLRSPGNFIVTLAVEIL